MEWENLQQKKDIVLKDILKKIKQWKEFKNFQIMINMKDYTKIVILMDLVYELILMGIFIKDNLTMVIDMEKELLS